VSVVCVVYGCEWGVWCVCMGECVVGCVLCTTLNEFTAGAEYYLNLDVKGKKLRELVRPGTLTGVKEEWGIILCGLAPAKKIEALD